MTKEEGRSRHKEVKEVENELSRDEAISQIEKEVESECERKSGDEAISDSEKVSGKDRKGMDQISPSDELRLEVVNCWEEMNKQQMKVRVQEEYDLARESGEEFKKLAKRLGFETEIRKSMIQENIDMETLEVEVKKDGELTGFGLLLEVMSPQVVKWQLSINAVMKQQSENESLISISQYVGWIEFTCKPETISAGDRVKVVIKSDNPVSDEKRDKVAARIIGAIRTSQSNMSHLDNRIDFLQQLLDRDSPEMIDGEYEKFEADQELSKVVTESQKRFSNGNEELRVAGIGRPYDIKKESNRVKLQKKGSGDDDLSRLVKDNQSKKNIAK